MAKLIVTFDIAWDDDKTYGALYEKLTDAIMEGLPAGNYWADTTSFFLISTAELPSDMAKRVWTAAGLRKSKDKLVVVDMAKQMGAACGHIVDQGLFKLVPFMKKLV
jgi:hypothetical protein